MTPPQGEFRKFARRLECSVGNSPQARRQEVSIWEVAEGGLSDGEPHFYAFGNPTRNSGEFHRAFNAQRHRWSTRQIDSRSVSIAATQNQEANEAYTAREKDLPKDSTRQVVLVSVDSIQALRQAYPNYFLDTTRFVELVEDAIAEAKPGS